MSVNTKVNGQLVKSAGLYSVSTPIGMADIYSTEEKEVGLWIDNKPLYQKTFLITPTSQSSTIDVSSLNIEKLIDRQATFTRTISSSNIQQKDVEYRTETNTNPNYGILCELRQNYIQLSVEAYTLSEITEIRLTIKYTKTADTPWSGKFVPQGYGYVSSGDIYSFEERRIGVWVDGKPLYQKTMRFTSGWSLGNWATLANLSSLNIERLVKTDGIFTRSSGGTTIQSSFNGSIFPESTNSVQYKVSVRYNNNGNLECLVLTYDDITYIDVTLQYTKTTDVAGSGEYVPSGDKAVHYSANEEVIGTWIDGSTLYRKVFSGLSLSVSANGTWVDTGINISNIDIITSCLCRGDVFVWNIINGFKNEGKLYLTTGLVAGSNIFGVNTIILEYTKTS
jgi:hypothetical protein